MINLETINQRKAEMSNKVIEAFNSDSPENVSQALTEFGDFWQEIIIEQANDVMSTVDSNALVARGARTLTSKETQYYEKVINAMKATNVKQALAELDVVMPETVIDDVFDNLAQNHPLLDAVDFMNTAGAIKWLMNTDSGDLATWSPLCAEIAKEITSGFKEINLEMNKLSAFIPVCKAMLDLGPVWLDRYVRTILSEALYLGLEEGILNGNGKNMPIGMRKDLSKAINPDTGYADKDKVTFTSFDPVNYGQVLATMAKDGNGKTRVVPSAILVVNPVDYLLKVFPATTIRGTDGTYRTDVLPFPTVVIQSTRVDENEAILGLPGRYFMAAGTGKDGKIDYSDEYQFLEDNRVYLTKFYGHGQPKDNNSYQLLDITNLKPENLKVEVVGGGTEG